MQNRSSLFLLALFFLVFSGCGVRNTWVNKRNKQWQSNNAPADSQLVHSMYMLGDAGKPRIEGEQDPVLRLLQHKLVGDSANPVLPQEKKTLVILGDNIYDYGLPPEDDNSRETAEKYLVEQLKIVKGTDVQKYIFPGNHDWHKMKPDGLEWVKRQQEFVDDYFDDPNVFFPKDGCPGPIEIDVQDQTVMVIIDSEWWVFPHKRPIGPSSPCPTEDESELLIRLRNIVERNKDKHIVITFHHPLISNGNHGGHYSLKDHIFPLTLVKDNLYIPLPVIGSIYPLMRKYGITPEDIPNPKYQEFVNGVISIVREVDYAVVVTGHDHNLQLTQKKGINHIVSGAGSKSNFIVSGKGATFVARRKGFAQLNYYNTGEVWVEFWSPSENAAEGELLFRKPLYAIPPSENTVVTTPDIPDYRDSTITLAVGPEYKSRFFLKTLLFGKAYRKDWAQPVEFQYLDMKTYQGGLTPIKMGGGHQTLSLRVKAGDGNQYTMRSINKDPALVLPKGLRKTFVEDIVQDGISTAQPYGALIVPKLAEAADLNHTEPVYRYVPFTPTLGEYLDEFGGMLALVEIRPDEDLSEFERFGNSENVVGTDRMLEQLFEDNDNTPDVHTFLKMRTLDVLIGDWDRHGDQWRWAEHDRDSVKGEIYDPIPRDRDQAFTQFNGLLSALSASPTISRQFTNFGFKIADVLGLMESGHSLDRRLLAPLDREQWHTAVKEVQDAITDEVISAAVHEMPKEVYPISGPEIEAKLKARRDDLLKYMDKYYDYLAKEVDIPLSDKHEYVRVDRLENGDTEISAYKRDLDPGDKEIEHRTFHRVFRHGETKKIWLYCLDGNDSVVVAGNAKKGMLVHVLLGEGNDYFSDESRVGGLCKLTKVYDSTESESEENRLNPSKETKVFTNYSHDHFEYNYDDAKYDITRIGVYATYDADFGFFLGAGFMRKAFGFNTSPFKSKVSVSGRHSLSTNSFDFRLSADYPSLFSYSLGLSVDALLDGPDYVRNYFGQTNESNFEQGSNIQPYRIGLNYYGINALVTKWSGEQISFGIGPIAEYASIFALTTPVVSDTAVANIFARNDDFAYLGAMVNLNMDFTDNPRRPLRGMKWETSVSHRTSLIEESSRFANLQSAITVYVTPNWPIELTFAGRLGAETNMGDFPFYHAATLGGVTNLRGHRRQRFAGNTSLYQNLEARLKLDDFSSYIVNGKIGLYGFFDNGRVFADGESSNTWHQGYGGGIWLDLFDLFVVSGSLGFSEEGKYLRVNSGFFF